MSAPPNNEAAAVRNGEVGHSTVKQALLKIGELRGRIAELEAEKAPPIAIIGAGVRAPGGIFDLDGLWSLLREGGCTVGPVPTSRWDVDALFDPRPGVPGAVYTRQGSFIEPIDTFDAAFFNVSGREAEQMDPQQRLLLEVSWEAVENAGIDPTSLAGQACGVFVGLMNQDYADRCTGTGTSASVASGRIAYVLGLQGPTMTVDTACSSSLVSLHLACKSLARAECTLALAGGVNLQVSAKMTIAECAGQMLAADGRCKTFDAAADGFGRSDGCVVLVLKRLDQAVRDNDRVLAVIRGSAVNHDGASGGLTVPNGPSQQRVLRAALADAGLNALDVDLIEAHGTGTSLGDPIELSALEDVYARGRVDPLQVGSVKTNFGHMEAAAGAIGVLKLALALRHRIIPPHLHLIQPNPRFEWDDSLLRVPQHEISWAQSERPRRAAVSAFGISGTNAHLIVEEAPAIANATQVVARLPLLLKLSGKSQGALRELAAAHAEYLADHRVDAAALLRTLNIGRGDFDHRLAVVAEDVAGLAAALAGYNQGEGVADLWQGSRTADSPQLAWLFSGQGAQYPSMGRDLYESEPCFRKALNEAALALQPHLDVALTDLMFGDESHRLTDTRYTQPALFALQFALARCWQQMGCAPSILLGHSVGEYAAACVAGIFELEDAAMLIAARGRLMSALCAPGAMAAVFASATQIDLSNEHGRVAIAAYNGPRNTVLSGEPEALERVLASLEERGFGYQRLDVSHAFHSPMMRPMLAAFEECAQRVRYQQAQLPMISNVSGRVSDPAMSSPQYWVEHVMAPVRFAQGIEMLLASQSLLTLEIGPQGTLTAMMRRCPGTDAMKSAVSLRRGGQDALELRRGMAQLYAAGVRLDWTSICSDLAAPVSLPTYRFQRQRYWLDEPVPSAVATRPPAANYALDWEPLALAASAFNKDAMTLVLLGDAAAVALWHASIVAAGARLAACVVATVGSDVVAQLAALDAGSVSFDLMLFATDDDQRDASALLEIMQWLVGTSHRLWVIDSDSSNASITPGLYKAMARVAPTELSANWGGRLLCQGVPSHSVPAVLAEIQSLRGEDAVRLDARGRAVLRLRRRHAETAVATVNLDPVSSYWISGGIGGVGMAIAEAFIARGARHLVLLSRRGEAGCNADAVMRLSAWREQGVEVQVPSVDVTDSAALGALLVESTAPLRGVVHAAGAEDFCTLSDLDMSRLLAVASAKVDGARALEAILPWRELDFFVAVSSVAALWGGVGSLHYAVANAWLDDWSQAGHAAGRPCVSLRYGPWAGTGMIDDARAAQLVQVGLIAMTPLRALAALDRALLAQESIVTVCDLDEQRFVAAMQSRRGRPFLSELDSSGTEKIKLPKHLAAQWGILDRREREARVWNLLERCLREVLRLPIEVEIAANAAVQSLGIDSLLAIEVRDSLVKAFGVTLPATYVFDFPTPGAMARMLSDALFGAENEALPQRVERRTGGAIAVIGMACRFPGGANNPEAFWELLRDGGCAVDDAPPRFDVARWKSSDPDAPGRAYTVSAGLIDEVDHFAAGFFGISPREALCMDPQQRLVLETSWEAIERAGHHRDAEDMRHTGVFIGVGANEYAELLLKDPRVTESIGHVPTGNALNAIAGRVSFVFDFEGPSVVVDTACSSSLVALQQAVEALRRGDCDYALAGGVNLALKPESFVMLCKGRMLGERGRCQAFDAQADGYVRGEGCGMLLLKPLERAERDGDPIVGVILGCAVNQDGRSSSLTSPNGQAQQRVLRAALRDAGISPDEVGYIEAHGTGTPLGDPIEMHAIAAVYATSPRQQAPLQVGSVKSNIGHLEAAAGVAGLIKALLSVQHGQYIASLHFKKLNPNIEVDATRVQVCTELRPWAGAERRVAGVSSFGFSGTNAHVIVAAYEGRQPPAAVTNEAISSEPEAFVLSARSEPELKAHALLMLNWIHAQPLSITALCATLRGSRADIGDWRLLVICPDRARLVDALAAFIAGAQHELVHVAQHRRRRQRADQHVGGDTANGEENIVGLAAPFGRLAAAWLSGWPVLWPQSAERRVVLPSHPFRRERYWPQPAAADTAQQLAQDLPGRRLRLAGSRDHCYELLASADSPAHVRDHRIFGEVLLAGASHIAASLCAGRASLHSDRLTLFDIAFEEALTFGNERYRWQLLLRPENAHYVAESYSFDERGEATAEAARHFSAQLMLGTETPAHANFLAPTGPAALNADSLYAAMEELGYHLGDSFRWLQSGWRDARGSVWQLRQPVLPEPAERYVLYPGLIDSCFHAIGECMRSNEQAGSDQIFVPFSVGEFSVFSAPKPEHALWCRAWLSDDAHRDVQNASGGAELFHADGTVIARVEHFRARRAPRNILHQGTQALARRLCYVWAAAPLGSNESGPTQENRQAQDWLLIGNPAATTGLCDLLHGCGCARVDRVDWSELSQFGQGRSYAQVLLVLEQPAGVAEGCDELIARVLAGLQRVSTLVAVAGRVSLVLQDAGWGEKSGTPALCAAAAMFRTLMHEQPGLSWRVIDVGLGWAGTAWGPVIEAIEQPNAGFVRINGSEMQTLHLRAQPLPMAAKMWVASGEVSFLVTGAFGGIGMALCAWLIEAGARHIVMCGRHLRDPSNSLLKLAEERGAHLVFAPLDVTDATKVRELGARFSNEWPALEAIFHAAGALDDGLLQSMSAERVAAVMAPKQVGTNNLLSLARQQGAHRFVAFSSISAWLGVPGQAAYAAGNAAMEAQCAAAAHPGLQALAVAWGPWAEVGMAARLDAGHHERARRAGVRALDPAMAFSALGQLLISKLSGACAVLDFDWTLFSEFAPLDLLSQLPLRATASSTSVALAVDGATLLRLAAEGNTQAAQESLAYCGAMLAMVTAQSLALLDLDASPLALGMDSLMAIEIRRRIRRQLHIEIDAAVLLDIGSVRELAEYLLKQLAASVPAGTRGESQQLQKHSSVIEVEL